MQRARFWILCAMGALVVISGGLLVGARYWAVSAKNLQNLLPSNVDMRLDNLLLNEVGSGNRNMMIQADSAQYFKTEDFFILDKVRAKIKTEDGVYDIKSDKGRYEQGQRIITLGGSVTVVDEDGGILSSNQLILKFEEGQLISQEAFCYSTPTVDFNGRSFIYYTKEKLLSAEGRVYLFID